MSRITRAVAAASAVAPVAAFVAPAAAGAASAALREHGGLPLTVLNRVIGHSIRDRQADRPEAHP